MNSSILEQMYSQEAVMQDICNKSIHAAKVALETCRFLQKFVSSVENN